MLLFFLQIQQFNETQSRTGRVGNGFENWERGSATREEVECNNHWGKSEAEGGTGQVWFPCWILVCVIKNAQLFCFDNCSSRIPLLICFSFCLFSLIILFNSFKIIICMETVNKECYWCFKYGLILGILLIQNKLPCVVQFKSVSVMSCSQHSEECGMFLTHWVNKSFDVSSIFLSVLLYIWNVL